MNALTQLEMIETEFKKLCATEGLDIEDLYQSTQSDPYIPSFIKAIESEEPTKENLFHSEHYLTVISVIPDMFLMTAAALSLWKLGANPKGVLLAAQSIALVQESEDFAARAINTLRNTAGLN